MSLAVPIIHPGSGPYLERLIPLFVGDSAENVTPQALREALPEYGADPYQCLPSLQRHQIDEAFALSNAWRQQRFRSGAQSCVLVLLPVLPPEGDLAGFPGRPSASDVAEAYRAILRVNSADEEAALATAVYRLFALFGLDSTPSP